MDKYFLAIMCCKDRLESAKEQKIKYLQSIDEYPIMYYHFIGNPNQQEEYIVDEKNKLVTLKCPDDYINLPYKTYCIMKYIYENHPNIKGVFKTDDDIELDLEELRLVLQKYGDQKYFGKKITLLKPKSNYISVYKKDVIKTFPTFLKYNIQTRFCVYCSGGGYYVKYDSIPIILDQKHIFDKIILNDSDAKKMVKDNLIDAIVFEDYAVGYSFNQKKIKPIYVNIKKAAKW